MLVAFTLTSDTSGTGASGGVQGFAAIPLPFSHALWVDLFEPIPLLALDILEPEVQTRHALNP